MRRRWPAVVRGLAAASVLLGVAVGVPLLLVGEVGWPLPTNVPTVDDVRRTIVTGAVTDATIVKTLAVLVWLAWANFALGFVTELVALVKGLPSRRVAGAATGQRLAGRLLSMISVAVMTFSRPDASAVAQPVDLRLAVATAVAEPGGPGVSSLPVAEVSEAHISPAGPDLAARHGELQQASQEGREKPVGSGLVYTVERGDTFWDLAERFLGDGLRWREIRAANIGRTQPDGSRIGAATEDLQVGWALRMPNESTDPLLAADADVVVEWGDTLWELADEHLDDGHRWPEIYELNRGAPQPDGRILTDPDLLRPGWQLDLPAEPVVEEPAGRGGATDEESVDRDATADLAEVPEEPSGQQEIRTESEVEPPAPTVKPGRPAAGRGAARPLTETPEREAMDEGEMEPATDDESMPLLVLGALAAGLTLTLDRVRRTRMRRREPGTRIPLPAENESKAEQRLRVTSDGDTNAFLDLALRELAELLAPTSVPRVRYVTLGPDDLHVHLDAPVESCPSPWRRLDGATWARSRPMDPSELLPFAGTPAPLPALVTLGRMPDSRVMLINLDGQDPVWVDAHTACGQVLLHTWALEIATTSRADAVDVVTAGIDDIPSGLERLSAIDPTELPRHLVSVVHPGDAPGPSTVIIAADGIDADGLIAAVRARRDLAAVRLGSRGDVDTGWQITVKDGRLARLPDGLEVELIEPCCSPRMTARLVQQALHDPDQLAQLPDLTGEENRPEPSPAMNAPAVVSLREPVEAPLVDVRILGPVEVVRAPGPFRTNKTYELVTYLAMHRGGIDSDTLMEALWPEQPPRAARLHTEVSRARKALGIDHDGNPLLPAAELGRYGVSDAVGLDYDRFTALVERSASDPDDAINHLTKALQLVRGSPLSSTVHEYTWATNDTHRITQQVVDTAHTVAGQALQCGQPDLATWGAEQGLLAFPYAELLYRDLMRAAAARGDLTRLPAIMDRLRVVLMEDTGGPDADDWLSTETMTLYEHLRASAGAPLPLQ